MRVSFVIPAYNEEKTVGTVVESLKKEFPSAEIVVVDDGSKDRTSEIATKAGADKVVRHENNQGLGGAISTGIRNATGDFCVIVDADGQHPITEVKKVVDSLDNTIDAVFTQRNSLRTSGWFKAFGKWILIKVATFLQEEASRILIQGSRQLKEKKLLTTLKFYHVDILFPLLLFWLLTS